eukprot:CAMPEP_0117513790 /NCGR_PEP_ID=MMETSP0784-20121206/29737_1 /TAXON_ID=39447 /ORGANISM="" /LENGTH=284 /DNA_ID=CAMNT_0005309569 /DNA_START=62 /DNA_END=917 /DNA_ORIENTATION=+
MAAPTRSRSGISETATPIGAPEESQQKDQCTRRNVARGSVWSRLYDQEAYSTARSAAIEERLAKTCPPPGQLSQSTVTSGDYRVQATYMRSSARNPWVASPAHWGHPINVARLTGPKKTWDSAAMRPINKRNYCTPSFWVKGIEEQVATLGTTYIDYCFTDHASRVRHETLQKERKHWPSPSSTVQRRGGKDDGSGDGPSDHGSSPWFDTVALSIRGATQPAASATQGISGATIKDAFFLGIPELRQARRLLEPTASVAFPPMGEKPKGLQRHRATLRTARSFR